MKKRNQAGFTLMELMVVIVIVAILAAVAVPLYINYVKDAQRTEAKGAIGAVIIAEQTYFQLNNAYAATTFTANPGPGSQAGLNCDLTEAVANWDISVTSTGTGGTSTFVVTAHPRGRTGGPGADVGDVTYSYDRNTGVGTWTP
jgi:type IV pilus assembly protein PilE